LKERGKFQKEAEGKEKANFPERERGGRGHLAKHVLRRGEIACHRRGALHIDEGEKEKRPLPIAGKRKKGESEQ